MPIPLQQPWQPNAQPSGMRQPAAMGALRPPGVPQMGAPQAMPGMPQGMPQVAPPQRPPMPQVPITPQGGPPPGGPPPGGPPQGMPGQGGGVPPGLQQVLAMFAQRGVPPQQAMAMIQQHLAQRQAQGPPMQGAPQGTPPRSPGMPPLGNFYR